MGEKMEVTKWYLWGLLLIVLAIIVLTALNWGLMPIGKKVERAVLVNSHQYQEGKSERIATFEASLIEIDNQLARQDLDLSTRASLEAQRSAINVQLMTARRK